MPQPHRHAVSLHAPVSFVFAVSDCANKCAQGQCGGRITKRRGRHRVAHPREACLPFEFAAPWSRLRLDDKQLFMRPGGQLVAILFALAMQAAKNSLPGAFFCRAWRSILCHRQKSSRSTAECDEAAAAKCSWPASWRLCRQSSDSPPGRRPPQRGSWPSLRAQC